MKRIVLLVAIIAAPASAQGLGSLQRQPDLLEQQRQDIANGRYGQTRQQQLEQEALRNQADRRLQQQGQQQPLKRGPLEF